MHQIANMVGCEDIYNFHEAVVITHKTREEVSVAGREDDSVEKLSFQRNASCRPKANHLCEQYKYR